jgi:hypothetical protein
MDQDNRLAVVIRRIKPSGEYDAIITCSDPRVVQTTIDALTHSLKTPPSKSQQEKTSRISREVARGVA